jgi:hypothetical protein
METSKVSGAAEAMAFGLIEVAPQNARLIRLTKKGTEFFKWYILNKE